MSNESRSLKVFGTPYRELIFALCFANFAKHGAVFFPV